VTFWKCRDRDAEHDEYERMFIAAVEICKFNEKAYSGRSAVGDQSFEAGGNVPRQSKGATDYGNRGRQHR
jgi:hypothetical protein